MLNFQTYVEGRMGNGSPLLGIPFRIQQFDHHTYYQWMLPGIAGLSALHRTSVCAEPRSQLAFYQEELPGSRCEAIDLLVCIFLIALLLPEEQVR